MPTLFLKCHACGHEFPSGVAHDVSVVGKVQLLGLLMRCPNCRRESRYSTHEFYFPKGMGDADAMGESAESGDGALPHDGLIGPVRRERPPPLQP